nr:hypothetical protein [Burkholderia gladioli]
MSWLFSQVLVEEYSAGNCSAGEPSAQLNVMPTPHKFWRNDKTIESSNLSRFGLTLSLLTERRGEELLTSYRAAFHVRTSAEPAEALESTAKDPACGSTWLGSFAKYDRDSSSWKTAQCSLLADSEEFSETWPRWGSMQNGESFLRQIPALPICESASGLWQTPVADDAIERKAGKWSSRGEPKLSAEVKLFPTPCAIDAGSGRINKSPTPGAAERPTLAMMARKNLWPTPTAGNSHSSGRLDEWGGSRSRETMRSLVTTQELTGLLNPDWEEWLMGWPIGWTALKPLETARYREWLQQHSPF